MTERRRKIAPQAVAPDTPAEGIENTPSEQPKPVASQSPPHGRSKKGSLKEIFRRILTQSIDADGELAPPAGATLNEAIALSIARMAAGGDLKAAAFILNILDEDDAVQNGKADAAPTIRVAFDIPRPTRGEKGDPHGN